MRILLILASCAALLAAQTPVHAGPVTVSGEADLIWQGYPDFSAAYSGPLSLPPHAEWHNTREFTLATSTALASSWRIELDWEAANGLALGGGTGLAGITNLDVTRNLAPGLWPTIFLARLYAQRDFAHGWLRIGRVSLTDDFDANAVLGGDHHAFMNWSTNMNTAWDFAADTQGYTDAVEWFSGPWLLAYALMPKTVNGMRLDWRSSQLGVQRTFQWGGLTLRPLFYATHAPLGRYGNAASDVEAVHRWTWKSGFGLSADEPLSPTLQLGLRAGVNNDNIEEYVNTEAGDALSVGLAWQRGSNRAGVAVASNGLFAAHAAYLARGGQGFLLGDGALAYGRENVWETYALHRFATGLEWGPDLQFIRNPGYNRARGPVWFFGLRLHAWF